MTNIAEFLIDMAYQGVKKIIEEDNKEAFPMAFIHVGSNNTVAALPLPFHDDAHKDQIMRVLRRVCANPLVTAYAMVSEAWMVAVSGDTADVSMMPRNHPDRIEVVQILAQERGQKLWMARAIISRQPDGRRTLGPCEARIPDGGEGRMMNWFEPETTKTTH